MPRFFAPQERAEFAEFLENLAPQGATDLVVIAKAQVIGCGGVMVVPQTGAAHLTWGMVARAHHGQGAGTLLTRARLARARAMPDLVKVALSTTQHTRAF